MVGQQPFTTGSQISTPRVLAETGLPEQCRRCSGAIGRSEKGCAAVVGGRSPCWLASRKLSANSPCCAHPGYRPSWRTNLEVAPRLQANFALALVPETGVLSAILLPKLQRDGGSMWGPHQTDREAYKVDLVAKVS
jgi:hypothetical protein